MEDFLTNSEEKKIIGRDPVIDTFLVGIWNIRGELFVTFVGKFNEEMMILKESQKWTYQMVP